MLFDWPALLQGRLPLARVYAFVPACQWLTYHRNVVRLSVRDFMTSVLGQLKDDVPPELSEQLEALAEEPAGGRVREIERLFERFARG